MRLGGKVVRGVLGMMALAAIGPAHAQSVGSGGRVRVKTVIPPRSTAQWVEGRVDRVNGDTLIVRLLTGGPPIALGVWEETRLRFFAGSHRSTKRGGAVGLFIGAVGGGVIGLGFADPCPPPQTTNDPPCIEGGPEAAKGALIGGLSGAVLGAVVGSLVYHDLWLPGPRLSVVPGLGIGLSVAVGMN